MLVVRLKPTGRKKRISYRVVVDVKRSKLNGKVIDDIGFYQPKENPVKFLIDQDKLKKWVSSGAELSKGVSKLLSQEQK